MTRTTRTAASSAQSNQLIDQLLEQIASQLQVGQQVDLDVYIRQYPEHAEQLGRLLPTGRLHLNSCSA